MSVATLRDYTDRLAGMPANSFIGSILWFTIAGERANGEHLPVRVQHDVLSRWFAELNLDPAFIPPKIKRIDAFRTATSELNGRKYPLPDGTYAELLVREVDSNRDFVLRHVIREIRDARGQKLSYDHVATLKFFRSGPSGQPETYRSTVLNAASAHDKPQLDALVQQLQTRFTDLCANLQTMAIRGMVRTYITSLNAIAVKLSGGVYFVHMSRQPTLDALTELVRRLGPNCALHQVPLVDTLSQREMLTESFESEVEDEVRLLLKEVAEANQAAKGGKIKVKKYSALQEQYTDIVSRSEEYTRVLGLSQERAGAALELALDSVMEMATRLIP